MSYRTPLVASLLLALGLIATPAGAASIDVRFSSQEIDLIQRYYDEQTAAPKARGRGRGLPPGIAKNLERGKALPPGIAKQYLPGELERRLPAPPDGTERIVVAGKILLIDIATRVIHDVLTDVLFD